VKALRFTCLFVLLHWFSTLFAQEEEPKPPWIELNGYIKSIQNGYVERNIASLTSANLFHNRLNFKFNFSDKLSGRLEIRNRIFYGDLISKTPGFSAIINQYNGYFKLSHLWVDEQTLIVHSVIDRLLLQYALEKWDIKIGRQRINWGINNVWNPNDIFNAYNFLDFDYEERPGNDAVRIQRFFDNNTTLELAYKPGKNADDHIGALLYKFNQWKYDFQFLSGIYRADVVLGMGWAGNIKDTGFKGEAGYFLPRNNTLDTTAAFSFTLMLDRTFKHDWYLSTSFLYNSNPTNVFTGNGIYNSNLSAKSLFPFKYNLYVGVMKTISPILSANLSCIYSPEKNTLILFPTFAWNIATNFDLDFTVQSFFSKESNAYHTQGSAFFLRGRWSY